MLTPGQCSLNVSLQWEVAPEGRERGGGGGGGGGEWNAISSLPEDLDTLEEGGICEFTNYSWSQLYFICDQR